MNILIYKNWNSNGDVGNSKRLICNVTYPDRLELIQPKEKWKRKIKYFI